MRIHRLKQTNFYSFVYSNDRLSDMKCDVCGSLSISEKYKRLVDAFKEKGFLPDDYPYICCACYGDLVCNRQRAIINALEEVSREESILDGLLRSEQYKKLDELRKYVDTLSGI